MAQGFLPPGAHALLKLKAFFCIACHAPTMGALRETLKGFFISTR